LAENLRLRKFCEARPISVNFAKICAMLANFGVLVLGFCKEPIFATEFFVLQHISRSTRFAHFCTALNSNFQ